MSDLINRQDAIDAISKYGSVWMEYTDAMTIEKIAERALQASKQSMVKILRELPSAQPKGEWIPCSEYTEDGSFLVTKRQRTGQLQVAIGNCYKGEWSGNGNFNDVLAWMPLPEPYTED